jgi:hypothetical protein
MGYIKHNAIVITAWFGVEHRKAIRAVRETAVMLGEKCTEIVESECNGYMHFMVAPDGSKEGWPRSDLGDSNRRKLCELCDELNLNYVEIRYGGDGASTEIIDHNKDE